MAYWIYRSDPWGNRPYKNVTDARKDAVKLLDKRGRDYVSIVKVKDDGTLPAAWMENFKTVGTVINRGQYRRELKGEFEWVCPEGSFLITPTGRLGKEIPKKERVWNW